MSKIYKKGTAQFTKPAVKRIPKATSDVLKHSALSSSSSGAPAFFKAAIPVTKADLLEVINTIPSDVVMLELMHGDIEGVPDVTMLCVSDAMNTTRRVFTTNNIVEYYAQFEHQTPA